MTNDSATLLFLLSEYGLNSMSSKFPFKLPRITEITDLTKISYVEYYVWDEKNEKLKRKRVNLFQPTKAERIKEGKKICAQLKALLESGVVINPKEKNAKKITAESTIIEAAEMYIEYIKKTLSAKSIESYATDIKRFVHYLVSNSLQNKRMSEFDSAMAIEFLEYLIISKGLSNRSRNNVRGTAGTFFNYYVKKKIASDNPFEDISNLRTVSKRHAALTTVHAQKMKLYCEEHKEKQLLLYIYFIYYCFIRSGRELKELRVQDIYDDTIFISGDRAKNDKGEYVKIPSVFNKILDEYRIREFPKDLYVFSEEGVPSDKMLNRDFIYKKHKGLLKALNLDGRDYTVYSWKHTGVIALWKVTQDIEFLRSHCRHSDVAMTTKYLRDLGLFSDYSQINMFPAL